MRNLDPKTLIGAAVLVVAVTLATLLGVDLSNVAGVADLQDAVRQVIGGAP